MTARLANPSRQMARVNEFNHVWCPKCQQWRASSEFRANRARKSGFDGWCRPCKAACDRERQARRKAERPARPPKPLHRVQPGDGIERAFAEHHAERRLAGKWPSMDPAACVHPGMAVWADDALDFLRECVKDNLCLGLVRGYVATVGIEASGLIAPRFERIETARLWNAVMKHRTGRRA